MLPKFKNMKTKKGPTFICIGPQKTGTTWLYVNLKSHPQVFLPNIKETRYLWERKRYKDNSFFDRLRLSSQDFHFREITHFFIQRMYVNGINSLKLSLNFNELLWELKYFLFKHTDDLYVYLFSPKKGIITGDISPQYWQKLEENDIRELSTLFPHLKVIILLRNPIERIWSHAKHCLVKYPSPLREQKEVSEADFVNFFKKNSKLGYLTLIYRWRKYFPKNNIHINYFDQLVEDPKVLYEQICTFLNIDFDQFTKKKFSDLKNIQNKGVDLEMPDHFAKYLAELNKKQIDELCEHFYPYPQKWANQCKQILGEK